MYICLWNVLLQKRLINRMKNTLLLILLSSAFLACNKLDDNPDLIGTWGVSTFLPEGHTLLINSDGTGHPYESPCDGYGELKVKLSSSNVLNFKKNGSTRKEYVITTFPLVASTIIPFEAHISCSQVEYVTDTIWPGEMYMILDDVIYLKKH